MRLAHQMSMLYRKNKAVWCYHTMLGTRAAASLAPLGSVLEHVLASSNRPAHLHQYAGVPRPQRPSAAAAEAIQLRLLLVSASWPKRQLNRRIHGSKKEAGLHVAHLQN